jgi:Flp pilus assembly protein TadD
MMLRNRSLRRLVAGIAVIAAVAAGVPAFAQSTGMVKGKVMDAANQPVNEAKVVIEFADGMNRKYEVKTNKKGEYIQIGLQPGNYKVTASKEGVGQQSFDVRVRLGTPIEVNFVITPAGPGGAPMSKEDVEFRKVFQEGVAALTANNFDEALAKFQNTSTLRADCFQCYLGLGEAYRGKEDWANAEASFKKAAELKPDAAEPYRGLRDLYNTQKKFDQAAAMAEEANKRSGNLTGGSGGGSAPDLYNQAATFWNAGKFNEAKAALDQALQIDANHADSHFLLGKVLVNQGQLPEALTSLEKYLQLAPSGTNAAEAKTLVDALKATVKK